jgi:hypothetical protein
MITYMCQYCGTTNFEAGRCNYCHKPLGSYLRATFTALIVSVLLSIAWIVGAYFSKDEIPLLSCFYGFIISYSVTWISGGIGHWFQTIASVSTFLVLLISYPIIVMILKHADLFSALRLMMDQLTRDPIIIISFSICMVGGFFIWKKIKL